MPRWRTLTRCPMTGAVVALLLRGSSSVASAPCLQRVVCGHARTALLRAFKALWAAMTIPIDTGTPFGSTAIAGLSALSIW